MSRKKKEPEVQIIFPGDWIKFIGLEEKSFVFRIGKVIEINEDLSLTVAFGARNQWDLEGEWFQMDLSLDLVIKKYPRFGVVPIPGKREKK